MQVVILSNISHVSLILLNFHAQKHLCDIFGDSRDYKSLRYDPTDHIIALIMINIYVLRLIHSLYSYEAPLLWNLPLLFILSMYSLNSVRVMLSRIGCSLNSVKVLLVFT